MRIDDPQRGILEIPNEIAQSVPIGTPPRRLGGNCGWRSVDLSDSTIGQIPEVFHIIRGSSIRFSTPYQAVLLTNGSMYFGHLQDYGSSYPVLNDVFYLVSQTDTETKQAKSSLIKRGKEMHEPDRMYLNPSQIVFVETVGTNSKVAQLIAQASH
jgi:hypothetical protein